MIEARSINNQIMQLTYDGEIAGEILYQSMFSLKATIKTNYSELYEIRPVGVFGTSVSVIKDGIEIANLKMNLLGQIVFSFKDENEFVFKTTGVFRNQFIIENKEGEKIIQYIPKFNWGKFNYAYDIAFGKEPQDALFVLLGLYASNYHIAFVTGSVAATI